MYRINHKSVPEPACPECREWSSRRAWRHRRYAACLWAPAILLCLGVVSGMLFGAVKPSYSVLDGTLTGAGLAVLIGGLGGLVTGLFLRATEDDAWRRFVKANKEDS